MRLVALVDQLDQVHHGDELLSESLLHGGKEMRRAAEKRQERARVVLQSRCNRRCETAEGRLVERKPGGDQAIRVLALGDPVAKHIGQDLVVPEETRQLHRLAEVAVALGPFELAPQQGVLRRR